MSLVYYLGGKVYDFLDSYFERTRYEKIRKIICSDLEGKILDAGCGTGRNFPLYSKKAQVTGVDKSQGMLEVARKRASESATNITLKNMDLKNLDMEDNSFDAIVATFVLCVMPKDDEQAVLKELIRVAKPSARMYFLEYTYSKALLKRMLMKATVLIPRALYGLRYNTTLPIIEQEEALRVEKLQFVYDDMVRLIIAKKIK